MLAAVLTITQGQKIVTKSALIFVAKPAAIEQVLQESWRDGL
jgi:hypothetical protein